MALQPKLIITNFFIPIDGSPNRSIRKRLATNEKSGHLSISALKHKIYNSLLDLESKGLGYLEEWLDVRRSELVTHGDFLILEFDELCFFEEVTITLA